ncbi:dehydrogenase/reductase SDR family member 4-like [Ptychodera flava]|uniref:dehydrogenase/reductase SDR family member 4-like n=1 Tax=Ptychodera flava TaxID=63121 RepID=UPI003969C66F
MSVLNKCLVCLCRNQGRLFPFFVTRMASLSNVAARKLEGKVAVVTGSTDGIGLAIARRLAEDGAQVVVSSRRQENVDRAVKTLTSENLDVSGMICHIGNAEQREHLLATTAERHGGIDILVQNAGVNPHVGPMLETTESQWEKVFHINVHSTFFLTKKAIPYMEARGGGSILYMASITAYVPFQLFGAYSISKTALVGLTKALAPPLAERNIRVNCLAPGIIKTKFASFITDDDGMLHNYGLSKTPMKRFGEPSDCAGAAAFLCSDDASFITGETIVIAGGIDSRL